MKKERKKKNGSVAQLLPVLISPPSASIPVPVNFLFSHSLSLLFSLSSLSSSPTPLSSLS
uniref:Uncharacterized protein n=1 Tax=Anguilla anguilla TaxID=7936 RepID=A0A0E9W6B4_ANGAN